MKKKIDTPKFGAKKPLYPIYLPRQKINLRKIIYHIFQILGGFVLLFVGFTVIAILQSGSTGESTPRDQAQIAVSESDANIMSITLCEMRARETLKAPRSAKFPWVKKASFDGSLAILKSYVDAQNSFGAMIRTNYICTLRYKGGAPTDSESWNIEEFITLE